MMPISLILLSTLLSQPAENMKSKPVRVSQAKVIPVAPRAYVPGTVISPDDAQLASEVSGKLVWVVDVGEYVKAGAAVARLDSSRLKLSIASQAAEVKRLEAMVKLRDRDQARQQTLADRNVGVAADLDRAQAEFAMAQQDVASARALLSQQQDELRRSTLRAPFAGQVVERLLQGGEFAEVGDPVVRLVNTERVEINARVPVRSAGFVRKGDEVPVRFGGRRAFATVQTIIQTGSFSSRSVTLRLSLPDDVEWLLGAAVSVGIPTAPVQQELVVPRDAIVLRAKGAHVIVVDEAGTAREIDVELGLGDGAWIAVRGEVTAGATVVSIGAESVQDGDAVEIVEQS
ncbi:MAG: efflux RND transporter periplasmic adaptor subunit [Myxococcota bacterium]